MSLGAIDFISEGTSATNLAGLKEGATHGSFSKWLGQEMNAVNRQIQGAEIQVRQLAAGEQDNLHQIMLSLEKAKLGFELALQVRNKLIEGYQEIMRMQV